MSAGWRENSRKAAAVSISNTVIGASPFLASHSASTSASSSSLDELAAARLRDAEALIEADQIGRGVDVHALSRRFQDRAHERDGGAFAVGAGDMDERRQTPFGMTERREEALDALERQIDALGMQRQQPRVDGVDADVSAGTRRGHAGAGRLKRGFAAAGRRLQQQPAKPGDGRAQIVAMHHHVDHAVGEQVLGLLKAFRQLFADGLLDDARAGETDQRARLGDLHVAEHGVRGGDAAGRRIGQHDDVGLARLLQLLHGDRGARHLHQGQNAFLHARAAGGGKQHERAAFLHRGVETLDDRLARRHAERAAHEIEILHRQSRRQDRRACRSQASPRR